MVISKNHTLDDFGIKYIGREHAQHLLDCLETQFTVTTDWTGSKYCGISLAWEYTLRHVDVSMPGYVEQALHRFQRPLPSQPQHAPHHCETPKYGQTVQFAPTPDESTPLLPPKVLPLQEVVGVLLYFARAVGSTMLVALSTIASAPTTVTTARAITHLLNYVATHPDASICFLASSMILYVHSDASYQSESKSCSRAGGYFFLSTPPQTSPDLAPPPTNWAKHVPSTILDVVVSSAAEAKLGAQFYNAKDAAWLRSTLEAMDHRQPPTPIQTDNACAAGICDDTVKQRRSKAMDMRFYWVRECVCQGHFRVHWLPGDENLADYFTKHHAPAHHRRIRHQYLQAPQETSTQMLTTGPSLAPQSAT
jgi:hypothetical protein